VFYRGYALVFAVLLCVCDWCAAGVTVGVYGVCGVDGGLTESQLLGDAWPPQSMGHEFCCARHQAKRVS